MDCDENNSSVVFYINGECVKIESDLEDIVKLKESNTFATNYIRMMVDNNYIEIPELTSIERVYEDGSICVIYNSKNVAEVLKAESEWGAPETELLLNKYNQYIHRVGLMDRFKTKKKMWIQIAEDIKVALKISKTETQCENRYKTIMKRKKKVAGFNVNRVSEDEGSYDILESIDDTMEIVRTDWSDPETKLLLHKYEQYSSMVGPMNKFKTCKQMWIKISEDINHILGIARTETQCENRFKAVMKKENVEDPLYFEVPEVKLRTVENSSACAVSNSQSADDTEADLIKTDSEWGGPETKLLLDKYEQYVLMVGSRFKTKKKMWAKISEDLMQILNVSKTDSQCENRYKTILRRKRRVDHNYHRAIDLRDDTKFEQELCKIVLSEEESESEPVRCVCAAASKKIRSDPPRSRNRRKGRWVVRDAGISKMRVLMAFQKRMEVNRERRHKEKMRMMEQLLQVLKN